MSNDQSNRIFQAHSSRIPARKPKKLDPINPSISEQKLTDRKQTYQQIPKASDEWKKLTTHAQFDTDNQQINKRFANRPVPIFKMTTNFESLNLVEVKGKEKPVNYIAKGILFGNYNSDFNYEDTRVEVQFQGNFKGVFQDGDDVDFYFEGNIENLRFLRIEQNIIDQKIQHLYQDITEFRGFFYGVFLPKNNSMQFNRSSIKRSLKSNVIQYFVPTFVRVDIREITNINMEQCSAEMVAYIMIDIQLNQEIAKILINEWNPPNDPKKKQEQQKKAVKHYLGVEFNRNKAMVLPFYDKNAYEYEESEDESEYQWDDALDGFDVDVEWNEENYRMSYIVRSNFTGQLDNTYGVFYAPCNLNTISVVLTFNKIMINDQCEINLACCDLQDFDFKQNYSPYIFFSDLQLGDPLTQGRLAKQIDRITKIRTAEFRDQGEFNIADNRTYMFPYHKNINQNTNTQTDNICWLMGYVWRKDFLKKAEVKTVRQNYEYAIETKNDEGAGIFKFEKWRYMHIGIPIYKYVVIDLISIYVPIIILSAISLLFFEQENGNNQDDLISLPKRIASGASILLAYIAFLPMIRQRIPPSPAITFLELVVYFSTIPNILGVIASIVEDTKTVPQFFADYLPFQDPFFLVSLIVVVGSFGTLSLSILVYLCKNYRLNFKMNKYKNSGMERVRSPMYLRYMYAIMGKRSEFDLNQYHIEYGKDQEQ